MNDLAEFLEAGALDLEHTIGTVVTLSRRGEVYWRGRASWVQTVSNLEAEPGGAVVAVGGRVLLRKAVCGTVPRAGDRLEVQGLGRVLVVNSVFDNVFDAVWSLNAVHVV